ncbi:hypothetical protein G7077_11110 [Sphingomonas piscis]|uniref:Uncharacterized protein n=1 Tax=Sphingomonas piscis TaxID=2714943 RepID=A0A6G7YRK9_9SPHN|nr:hypothetical protein [Sphingomonas piscis]QIK79369.1 hypothetical protein G7077_11110 [Sphingomonas piscis]
MSQTFEVTADEQAARAKPVGDDPRAVTARRIFRGALIFNTALTVFWLVSWATDSRFFFAEYRITRAALLNIGVTVVGFYVLPGLFWWGIKSVLLRWVGFDKAERRDAFSSRMDRPYDVGVLTSKYSERKIRIADMVGRRGRFALLAFAGLYFLYTEVLKNPKPDFATAFATNNLFEGVVGSWIFLGLFHVNGWVGAIFYGPQTRVMDGYLGRANCLLITTLWTAFKFILVPLSLQLAAVYPREQFAVVFGLIWLSYITTDAFAEIFGSLFGRQSIKVWGVGDVNRKSVVGVVAGFAGALAVNLALIGANGLMLGPWIGLAVVIALSNCLVELYSPRGTDDFTMATANALLCLAFGAWVL